MTRRVGFAIAAMTLSQVAVYVARPMTSYRLLGLGWGAREVGLVAAAFALLPLFLAIPLGRASDRRRAPIVTVGCALQVIACLLLARVSTPWTLAAASALLGVGHLGVALGVQDVIARDSAESHHDRHFGLLTAGVSLGQLVGPLVGGLIVGDAAGRGLVGPSARALVVAAGVVFGAALLAAVADRTPSRAVDAEAMPRGSVRSILTLPGVPAGLLASIAVLSAADIFTAYMPVLGEQRAIAPAAVGVLLALRAGASVAARLGITWLVERIGRTRLIAFGALAAACAFGAIAYTSQIVVLGILAVVVGAGLGYGQPLSMTLVVQRVPAGARATALAVRLTGNRVGQVAAPAGAGVVAGSAGAGAVFWLIAGVLALSAAAVARTRP